MAASVVAAPVNAMLFPSVYTIGVLAIFVLANTARISADLYRPFGLVIDVKTKQPLPYALVTLSALSGERRAFAISDTQGRYFLLADPGTYTLTVVTPAQTSPQRSHKLQLTTKKGWVREKVGV